MIDSRSSPPDRPDRRRYSERYGGAAVPPRQVGNLNKITRNAIWNDIEDLVGNHVSVLSMPLSSLEGPAYRMALGMAHHIEALRVPRIVISPFARALWVDHWGSRAREVKQRQPGELAAEVEDVVVNSEIEEVFDVLEILLEVEGALSHERSAALTKTLNNTFRRHNAAYGIVADRVGPIDDEHEQQMFEETLAAVEDIPGAHEQLLEALRHLANDDLGVAVTRAINAAEAAGRALLGGHVTSTLGEALGEARKQGLIDNRVARIGGNLWGEISNSPNVRHGSTELSDVDRELAVFLVSSAATLARYLADRRAESPEGPSTGSRQNRRSVEPEGSP